MRLAWVTFGLFVVVSWPALGFYLFIAGGASCKVTGHCLLDGIVFCFAVALLPIQTLIAAYLKQRSLQLKSLGPLSTHSGLSVPVLNPQATLSVTECC